MTAIIHRQTTYTNNREVTTIRVFGVPVFNVSSLTTMNTRAVHADSTCFRPMRPDISPVISMMIPTRTTEGAFSGYSHADN